MTGSGARHEISPALPTQQMVQDFGSVPFQRWKRPRRKRIVMKKPSRASCFWTWRREARYALVDDVPGGIAVQVPRRHALERREPLFEPPLVAVDRLHVVDPALPLAPGGHEGYGYRTLTSQPP